MKVTKPPLDFSQTGCLKMKFPRKVSDNICVRNWPAKRDKKMAIFVVRFRTGETGSWELARQRATLAGDPGKIRADDRPADLTRMLALRLPLDFTAVDTKAGLQPMTIPEMIDDPRLSFRIMRH